jgi:hypothetical protein
MWYTLSKHIYHEIVLAFRSAGGDDFDYTNQDTF